MSKRTSPATPSQALGVAVVTVLVAMIIAYLVLFPIPPLVDLLAHISLSLGYSQGGSAYYEVTSPVSYKLLHFVVLGSATLSSDYTVVSGLTHFFTLSFVFSTTLIIARSLTRLSPTLLALILTLMIPVLHSLLYLWGTVPFFLAFWSFLGSVFTAIALDTKLAQRRWEWKTFALLLIFAIYFVSTLLSHPIGIVLSGITCVIFALLRLLYKGNARGRLLLLSILSAAVLYAFLNDFRSTGADGLKAGDLFQQPLSKRVMDLISAQYYQSSILTGGQNSTPAWYDKSFGLLFSALPFIAFFLIINTARRDAYALIQNRSNQLDEKYKLLVSTLTLAALATFCLVLIFGPDRILKVSVLPSRLYPAMAPLVIAVICVQLCRLKAVRLAAPFYPAALLFFLYILSPLYSRAQLFTQQSDMLAESLVTSINHARTEGSTVILRYKPAVILDAWFHNRVLPFMMSANPKVLSEKIVIINEWNDSDLHLPVRFLGEPKEGLEKYEHLIWDVGAYPNFPLSKPETATH